MNRQVIKIDYWGVIFWVILALAQSVWGIDIYVDDDGTGDPGPGDPLVSDPLEDGSLAHPFDAIQEAIEAAVGGDTGLDYEHVDLADNMWINEA